MSTQRPLGAVHAAALVVASMVGTGIFTTTGVLLTSLPSPAVVLAAWALSGLLALCGAAVYAELGAMMPRVGGEYVYVSRAFGPVAGFMSGWVALIVVLTTAHMIDVRFGARLQASLAALVIAVVVVFIAAAAASGRGAVANL